ncbi:MAG: phosphate ABC transporter permease PstA [Desulfuromonadaceae bacterium]|nr:phosphate ABC transporter permease PstA [Desulfuromonadaceae bacterium]
MKTFISRGEPQVWLTAAALTTTLLMGLTLIVVVMINGLGAFWPSRLVELELQGGQKVLGELLRREPLPDHSGMRQQFKVGNRDLYGMDFRWVDEKQVIGRQWPQQAITVERSEYGHFFGFLKQVVVPQPEQVFDAGDSPWQQLASARKAVAALQDKLDEVMSQINSVNYALEKEQDRLLRFDYQGVSGEDPQRLAVKAEIESLKAEFAQLVRQQRQQQGQLTGYYAQFEDVNGRTKRIELDGIVRCYPSNELSLVGRCGIYASKLWELLSGEPRESNTEGGLFPAIFGTVLLVFVMSLFSFPLGVIAAVYLREYAGDGLMVRLVRIAVNNLAGIPSIVYGIFGLGFFVYGIGSGIDQLFFPERLPTPTFGTGGLLWASLTLALLTVPVVIVTTEEALGAIPGGIREGSLALGSTRFQTLTRILLPMASPGIMTGLILSMARAAGEVAPLMITGVVKLAPALPLDGQFPFFHLERKFMHLGFHIYDIGFQSPNVEAARPMVFVTTLLLVLIVLLMSGVAIRLRNRMKKKYTFGTF